MTYRELLARLVLVEAGLDPARLDDTVTVKLPNGEYHGIDKLVRQKGDDILHDGHYLMITLGDLDQEDLNNG